MADPSLGSYQTAKNATEDYENNARSLLDVPTCKRWGNLSVSKDTHCSAFKRL